MKIKYLTYECSASCNMNCRFCFSSWREQSSELNTEQAKHCIDILVDRGLEAINFTGGEPLLRKDIAELLGYCKESRLTTVLSTNGILLREKLPDIAKYLDFVGLPLDSSSYTVHNSMRATKAADNHHAHVLGLIDMINENYPELGVKINTIVTKQNKDSLVGIGDLIQGKTIAWKLSHFIPGAYGKIHQQEFEISAEDYKKAVMECSKKHHNLVYAAAHARDDSCRILSADGRILLPTKDGLQDLGALAEITEQEMVSGFNEQKNVYFLKKTYPGVKVV
jgi:MoaA/NifB/PqqE/SkfB family radical SAM enzyme